MQTYKCEECNKSHDVKYLELHRTTQQLLCPLCGTVIVDLPKEEEQQLKIVGDFNEQHAVSGFVIHDVAPQEDQYFLMYGMSDYEPFNPSRIRGVWGAQDVAQIMSTFRSTAILRIPLDHLPRGAREFEVISGVRWVHILKPDAMLVKHVGMNIVPLPKDVITYGS